MPNIANAHTGTINQKKSDFSAAQTLDAYMPNWINEMSMSEIDTYIDTTAVDLAGAIIVIKQLAHAVKICGLAVQYIFNHQSPLD